MANVYDYIDMSCLPDEYLPDDYEGPSAGPAKQIIGIMHTLYIISSELSRVLFSS